MSKNYTDFVEAMTEAHKQGLSVERVVVSEDSLDTFLTDDNFTEETEEKHDKLGEFEVPIETGDGNYVLCESGERVPL